MNRRLFNLLGVAAAVLVIAVLALNWLGPQKPDRSNRDKLLPDFAAARANIDRIQLSSNGKLLVELKRDGAQWLLANRDGYAANAGMIRSLLDNLSQAEKTEAKTADPARYEKLGLKEDSDNAVLLTLQAGETPVAALVIGNAAQRPAGQFVRLQNDNQSWLIDRELTVSRVVADWLRTDLINLPAAKLKQVERLKAQTVQCIAAPCLPVAGAREFMLSKEKPEDSSFTLTPIPSGKEAGAAWLLSGLTDALNSLSAADVSKQAAFDFSTAKTTISRYVSFDDQIVTLQHHLKDGKHYISLNAEAGAAATDEVKKAVEELNARHAGWLYEVSGYKGEGMARELSALVQDKAKDKPAAN